MNDLKKSIEFTEYVLQEKFKITRKNQNTLMNQLGKYMNVSLILNMFITNQLTQKILPIGTTSGLMGLQIKAEKVGIIAKFFTGELDIEEKIITKRANGAKREKQQNKSTKDNYLSTTKF